MTRLFMLTGLFRSANLIDLGKSSKLPTKSMTRKVTSYRLTEMTLRQIKELAAGIGASDANVIATAIDRMCRETTRPTQSASNVIPPSPG